MSATTPIDSPPAEAPNSKSSEHAREVLRQGDFYPLLYVFSRTALWWMFCLNGGVTIEGAENVPRSGAAIIAANHSSHTDPPLIAATNRRPVTIMGKEELFRVPILGPYIRHLGTFPVKRGTADRVALRMAIDRLAAGRLVLMFPEGTRGDGVNLQSPERGMGLIAVKSGAPVIPTYIHGTSKMMPRGQSGFHRAKGGVVYGKPVDPKHFSGKTAGEEIGAAVMAAIEAMRDARQSG